MHPLKATLDRMRATDLLDTKDLNHSNILSIMKQCTLIKDSKRRIKIPYNILNLIKYKYIIDIKNTLFIAV